MLHWENEKNEGSESSALFWLQSNINFVVVLSRDVIQIYISSAANTAS